MSDNEKSHAMPPVPSRLFLIRLMKLAEGSEGQQIISDYEAERSAALRVLVRDGRIIRWFYEGPMTPEQFQAECKRLDKEYNLPPEGQQFQ